jgi:hypothetical protein
LYHLARADFLERTRRYSFLVMLGLIVYLGYAVNAGQIVLRLNTYRGVFNSAWVGSMMTMVVNFFLGWFGFYLIKNATERDDQTGVGQIMATTPLTRPLYTLGKWLSNFAVLGVMVVILVLAAIVMQFIQREDPQLNLWALVAPFLFVALPMMALVSAVAVLFETISWLRGGFGNVVYFFVFMFGTAFLGIVVAEKFPMFDPFGLNLFSSSMSTAAQAAFPAYDGGFALGIMPQEALQVFYWPGVNWTADIILWRLLMLGAAAGIALLAAVFFNRFDPSRERVTRRRGDKVTEAVGEGDFQTTVTVSPLQPVTLSPVSTRFTFSAVLRAELRLMLQGQRWWWYGVAVILIGVGLFSPAETARSVVLPLCWIWPMLVWSSMGNREARHATYQMVLSAARPLTRQLPATWLAGVIVAALTGSGVLVPLMLAGDASGLFAWLVGALFIPSLALALGVWSGTSKLFEVIYTLLWYIGPMNRVSPLDYAGASGDSRPAVFLIAALVLAVLAVVGRWRQLQA